MHTAKWWPDRKQDSFRQQNQLRCLFGISIQQGSQSWVRIQIAKELLKNTFVRCSTDQSSETLGVHSYLLKELPR